MALTINGTNGIETNTDTGKLKLGTDDDLRIYHDGSNSYIQNTTGNLIIEDDSGQIFLQSTVVSIESEDGETQAKFTADGAVELYYNNVKKLETTSTGVKFTENTFMIDNKSAHFGTDNDMYMYHDGSNGWITNTNGDLIVNSANFYVNNAGQTETMIKASQNGAVELRHDNAKKLETLSTGGRLTGTLQAFTDKANSAYTSSTGYSVFQIHANGTTIAAFEHTGGSTPYGQYIYFSDAAPDNHTQYFLACNDTGGARLRIYSDGDVWTSDDSYLSSDETLKENIADATPKLEDLKKLKVRNFNWKESYHPEKSKQKQLGFIAQEVEQVFPALISEHDIAPGTPDDGHTPVMKKAIKAAWDPIIIKAMQELIAKVETLETKVAALEAA